MDRKAIERLLLAMTEATRPLKSEDLGVLGKDHLKNWPFFGVRRFPAAFFLSVFNNNKQNKAAEKRRTPKNQNKAAEKRRTPKNQNKAAEKRRTPKMAPVTYPIRAARAKR